MSTQHPQVLIAHDEWEADVDERIAFLILALWRDGIPTICSCQGGDDSGPPWIAFASVALAERAMDKLDPKPSLVEFDASAVSQEVLDAQECREAVAALVWGDPAAV